MVSGLGLAMVARLVPQRMMGFIMGAWFMTTAVAMVLGGFVASLTSVPQHVQDHFKSLYIYTHVFLEIGIITLVIAIIMAVVAPKLTKLAEE